MVSRLGKSTKQSGYNSVGDFIGHERDIADSGSFSSFIESHGQSLLDLSLYVSSENYRSTTLPAYSCLLSWPEQWLVPSQHRAIAKSRTAHLNLSSLDLDDNRDAELNRKSAFELIPDSLRYSRQSVSSLVSSPQHASRFRLSALADAWMEPLQELLGDKSYLLSDQPSSLDCLAFAFLALSIVPVVPQPWLKESVTARYPALAAYVNKQVQLFGGPIGANHAMGSADTATNLESSLKGRKGSEGVLPWREPQPRGFRPAVTVLVEGTLSSLPIIGEYQNGIIIPQAEAANSVHVRRPSEEANTSQNTLPAIIAIGATVIAIGTYLFSAVLPAFPSEAPTPKKRRLSDLGEAGALLSMAGFGGSGANPRNGKIPVSEVAVIGEDVEAL